MTTNMFKGVIEKPVFLKVASPIGTHPGYGMAHFCDRCRVTLRDSRITSYLQPEIDVCEPCFAILQEGLSAEQIQEKKNLAEQDDPQIIAAAKKHWSDNDHKFRTRANAKFVQDARQAGLNELQIQSIIQMHGIQM